MNRGILAVMALLAVGIVGYLLLSGEDDRYLVKLEMTNAGGLKNGANVRVAGAPSGRVTKLELNGDDLAVAELRLEPGVAPIGKNASALIDTDGLFGERFVQINRGDLDAPQPSGSVIDRNHATVSVRLDDVIDSLDLDTRNALGVFINEQGAAIVGRGADLAEVLGALPPGLDKTGELLDQFAADNQALGRLVEASDRVVGSIAPQRKELGRLIGGLAETLDLLDSRRNDLGETVRRAPATLQAAQRALVALDATARPLIPAAQGLRTTAPALTETLQELPGFTQDALPALRTAARVAPDLQRLADQGTPVVRELAPMARTLANYTRRGLDPLTELLDEGAADVFGTMEGWARSTQGRDAASHIFRFGASSGSDVLALLLGPAAAKKVAKQHPRAPGPVAPQTAPAPAAQAPTPAKLPNLSLLPDNVLQKVDELLKQKPADTVTGLLDRLKSPPKSDQPLLDYLLGP
jgi:phospholipid/cholesterol/gamma-HCH transport system substrate-binding protein